jgi:hypothetical protein
MICQKENIETLIAGNRRNFLYFYEIWLLELFVLDFHKVLS